MKAEAKSLGLDVDADIKKGSIAKLKKRVQAEIKAIDPDIKLDVKVDERDFAKVRADIAALSAFGDIEVIDNESLAIARDQLKVNLATVEKLVAAEAAELAIEKSMITARKSALALSKLQVKEATAQLALADAWDAASVKHSAQMVADLEKQQDLQMKFNKAGADYDARHLKELDKQLGLKHKFIEAEAALDARMAKTAAAQERELARTSGGNRRLLSSLRGLRDDMTSLDQAGTRLFRHAALGFSLLSGSAVAAFGVMAAVGIAKYGELEEAANKASSVFASGIVSENMAKGIKTTEAAFLDLNSTLRNKLIQTAREVGIATSFSADEVATGIESLAQAGIGIEDARKGIATVAQFAQASGEDMVTTSELLVQGFIGAGNSADEFGEKVGRLSDELTFAATDSAQSLKDILQGFQNDAAAAFTAYGQSASETINVLNLLGSAGIKGLKGGTSAAIVIRDIFKSANASPEAFKKYGIAVTNADGTTRSFAAILDDLTHLFREQTNEFTQPKRFDALRKEFGFQLKSFRQLQSLLVTTAKLQRKGSGAQAKLNKQVAEAGGLLQLRSEAVVQTFTQRFQQFRETIGALLGVFGAPAAQLLTEFFGRLTKGGLGANSMFKHLQDRARDFGKVFRDNLEIFLKQITGPEGKAFFAGIVDGMSGVLKGVKGFFTEFTEAFNGGTESGKSFLEILGDFAAAFGQLASDILPRVGKALGQIGKFLSEHPEAVKNTVEAMIALLAVSKAIRIVVLPFVSVFRSLSGAFNGIRGFFAEGGVGGGISGSIGKVTRSLAGFGNEAFSIRGLILGLRWQLARLGIAFGPLGLAVTTFFAAILPGAIKGFASEMKKSFGSVTENIGKLKSQLSGLPEHLLGSKANVEKFNKAVGELSHGLDIMGQALGHALGKTTISAINATIDTVRFSIGLLTSDFKSMGSSVDDLVDDLIGDDGLVTALYKVSDAAGPGMDALKLTPFGIAAEKIYEMTKAGDDFENHSQSWFSTIIDDIETTREGVEDIIPVSERMSKEGANGVELVHGRWKEWNDAITGVNVEITKTSELVTAMSKEGANGVLLAQGRWESWTHAIHGVNVEMQETAKEGANGISLVQHSWESWKKAITGVHTELEAVFNTIDSRLLPKTGANGENVARRWESWKKAIHGINVEVTRLGDKVDEVFSKTGANGEDLARRTWKSWEDATRGINIAIDNIGDQVVPRANEVGKDTIGALRDGVVSEIPAVSDAGSSVVGAMTSSMRDKLDQNQPEIHKDGEKLIQQLADGAKSRLEDAKTMLKDAAHDIYTTFKAQISAEEEPAKATKVFGVFKGQIMDLKTGASDTLSKISSDVRQLDKTMAGIKRAAGIVIRALRIGIGRQAPALAKALANMVLSLGTVAIRNVMVIAPRLVLAGATMTNQIARGITEQVAVVSERIITAGKLMMAFFATGMKDGAKLFVVPVVKSISAAVPVLLKRGEVAAKEAGTKVMTGFYNGMKDVFDNVIKPFISGPHGVAQWIRDNKGPISYDQTLLRPAGEAIMTGFKDGLADGFGEIKGWVTSVGPYIADLINDDMFFERSANFLIGNAKADLAFDPDEMFKDLLPDIPLGLHPTTSAADTAAQAHDVASFYGASINSLRRLYDTVAGAGVSQHLLGQAGDFGPPGAVTERMAKGLSLLIDKVFKQIIWNNSLWRGGKSGFGYVGGHKDHLHAGWVPAGNFSIGAGGFRQHGGMVNQGSAYVTGENGPELFIPSSRGNVMTNSDMQTLVNWLRDSGSASGAGSVTNNQFNTEIKTNSSDPETVGALWDARMRSTLTKVQR